MTGMFISFIVGMVAATIVWLLVLRNNRKHINRMLDIEDWATDIIDEVAGVSKEKARDIADALKDEIKKLK